MGGHRSAHRRLTLGRMALLVSLALLAAACGGDSDEPGAGSGDGAGNENGGETLTIGATLDISPYAFVDEGGDPVGMEVDMVNAMADELGYEIEYEQVPFEQVFVGLGAERYRFVGAAVIFITCERISGAEGDLEFTVPFYGDDIAIVVPADKVEEITSLEDLEGMTVGHDAKGSTGDALTRAFLKDNPGLFEQEYFENIADSSLALQQGRIDAAVGSRIAYTDAIKNKPDLAVGESVPDSTFPVGLVFRPGDELKDEFSSAIDALKENGTIAEIWEEWLGAPPPDDSPAANVVPEVTEDTCKSRG